MPRKSPRTSVTRNYKKTIPCLRAEPMDLNGYCLACHYTEYIQENPREIRISTAYHATASKPPKQGVLGGAGP